MSGKFWAGAMPAGRRRDVIENSKSRGRANKIRIKIMTKTSKLQLNQPDATSGSGRSHHAEIIPVGQPRSVNVLIQMRKHSMVDIGYWMFADRRAEELIFRKPATQARVPRKHSGLYGGIGQNFEKPAKLS
ncbi:MAG: hypothetical protein WA183_13020 [Chthoniobacterales bacterium]